MLHLRPARRKEQVAHDQRPTNTKKERFTRSLYCFDYGICTDNNLGFATDKNILRQQRFAYDEDLAQFDSLFEKESEVGTGLLHGG
jgi:hypothetical protein